MLIYRLNQNFKCRCGKEIGVLARFGIVECFDCLLKTEDAKEKEEPEDWEGLHFFLAKAKVPEKRSIKLARVKSKKVKRRSKITDLR